MYHTIWLHTAWQSPYNRVHMFPGLFTPPVRRGEGLYITCIYIKLEVDTMQHVGCTKPDIYNHKHSQGYYGHLVL